MPKTVLIVEDNPVCASLMKYLLDTKDFNTVHASTGGKALQLACDCRPDLIIMDAQLPDISGIEVTNVIKADNGLKSIPIIVVTAFASKTDEKTMLEGGSDAYITKPFSAPHLLETIERLVTHRTDHGRNFECSVMASRAIG
jgi:two-component system, cell cycle response regulator DivK